ncbi:hypothetical protein CTAYLR_010620 [Chrysophaeum taylorii]|uniref:CDP-diacylglycerol--glycerol-3-phosphate 3-phosphatidyltransferase n=1 Tax=Chrysophaeum taylorii TaxID=2483200 RepID=A0AAD7XR97_9STRA|nr:hypothetical protein CTAYLR_010620 [Chrysophaeum taylorii]
MLTFSRLCCVPVVGACAGWHPAAAIAFGAASATDWFDGYLARKWDAESALGAFLDPVVDKLLVCVALISLQDPAVVPAACVVVNREIAVSALREWCALRQQLRIHVSKGAKLKTATQMLGITLLLSGLRPPGLCFLYLSAALSLSSGIDSAKIPLSSSFASYRSVSSPLSYVTANLFLA